MFKFYEPMTNTCIELQQRYSQREAKEKGVNKKDRLKLAKAKTDEQWLKASVSLAMEHVSGFTHSTDIHILFEEWMQRRLGNHHIFPQNKELIELVFNASYNIPNESIDLPVKTAIIVMPDCELDGVKLVGCQFQTIDASERQKLFPIFSHKMFGTTHKLHSVTTGKLIVLSYFYNNQYHRCLVPVDQMNIVLKEVDGVLNAYGNSNHTFTQSLNSYERKVQYTHLRVCCGLCAYINSLPNKFTKVTNGQYGILFNGLPKSVKDVSVIKMLSRKESGDEDGRKSPIPHFRTLRHSRFRRDERGKPRTILVMGDKVISHITKNS